jgi:uncharacterized repeat protein (TIGR01451 family)
MIHLRPLILWTVAIVFMLLSLLAQPASAASRVSNTAKASWSDQGAPRTLDSNQVDIDVDTSMPPAIVTTFRPIAGGGGDPVTPIRVPGCVASSAVSLGVRALTDSWAGPLAPSTTVHAGDVFIFKLAAPAANRDPTKIDTVTATITTTAGDLETLTVFETDVNSGVFAGIISTSTNPVTRGNCSLELGQGDTVTVDFRVPGVSAPVATAHLDASFDPWGFVFDSDTGAGVTGARVTLIDVATGQPALVRAPDGSASWPSTVTTGQSVTDGNGATYLLSTGEYRFPVVAPGQYRLTVEPPAPYVAPSKTSNAALAGLTRPDGSPLILVAGSRGETFSLASQGSPVIDIPLDQPGSALGLTKTASVAVAQAGDQILYTVTVANPDAARSRRGVTLTDVLPDALRLRLDTVRIDGKADPAAVTTSTDGRQLTVALGVLAPSAKRIVTYVLTVRPDAGNGQAINRARTTDAQGVETTASATVRITAETIDARMTIIGRITDGPCRGDAKALRGVGGIRVMLEDGSYAITDGDGRYHFEGVMPGSHVVQVDRSTLPSGGSFVDCTRSTRSAGSATSRFVQGQGGQLVVADFRAVLPPSVSPAVVPAPVADADGAASPAKSRGGAARPAAEPDPAIPTPLSDKAAAGAERNWFESGSASIAWLFPEADDNPRQPAVRIAIRHLVGQKVALFADGKPVDPIAFDGTRNDPTNSFTVSLWRGVPLSNGANHFTAEVRNEDGSVAAKLTRDVYFTSTAARAEYLPEKSRLIADGVARPVIAVRFVDSNGRPVHAGTVGDFALPAPYEPAVEIDAEQARVLSGLDRAAPVWRVAGDDGIAYIQLAPTTTSGALSLDFSFRERDQVRKQKLEAWLSPGDRPWTIVGVAEGRAGYGKLAANMQPLAGQVDDITTNGRIAFYAKGRIKGSVLLTVAYDSAKKRDDQQLTGAIDPNTYYTVYADRSERRFDAASVGKLYLKLEARQFYALFGDFETGFVDTQLGRYVRTGNGVKTEYRTGGIAVSGFAAKFPSSHRHDEIQGNGLSAGYTLSSRNILSNSEQVAIQVRDRLQSEKIIDTRTLTRFVDYDIDYTVGTIRFSSPVLSRDSAMNPQFVVVDYEVVSATGEQMNAGARATWTSGDGKVRIGATGLRDAGDQGRKLLGAADARVRLGGDTEIRGEIAASRSDGGDTLDTAWLLEFEKHTARYDILAYARRSAANYGVGQQNDVELGRRKIGVDARYRLTDKLVLSTSAWTDDDVTGDASRRAIRSRLEYTSGPSTYRLGMAYAHDSTDEVSSADSTLIEAGATRKLMGGKLELDGSASFSLGKAESVDFPAEYKAGARYQLSSDVTLTGSYDIATGADLNTRTARIGFDLKPWAGAKLTSSVGDQDIDEYGKRAFAAYGLAQSFQLGKRWSIDATLDGARTLSGIDAAKIVNPLQPQSTSGYIGSGDLIAENFTAVTLGATYRANLWSGTGRVEYRFGELGDRAGATFGLIRRLGEGSAVGALATWTHAEQVGGATTGTLDAAVSGAYRPATSQFAVLGKLSWVEDQLTGGVAGAADPAGNATLLVSGDAISRRVVGSLSVDWAPQGRDENGTYQRDEVSLFLGGRYAFDRIYSTDLAGFTTMAGLDARIGLGERFEVGVSGTIRGDLGEGNFSYAYGPSVGFRPVANTLVTVGWNLHGFADRDFAGARSTSSGAFASMKLKFDQDSFSFLGLGRR